MGSTDRDEVFPTELLEAHYHGWNHSLDFMPSMALRCALQLGIPDIISNHDGPVILPDLVAQLSIPQAKSCHLHRVMQLLVHLGYFTDQDQQGYTLTSLSKLLVSNNNELTLAPFLLLNSDPILQTPSFFLADWFRGGPHPTPFETVHGANAYEYSKKHAEFNTRYNEANATVSEVEMRGMLKDLIPKLEGFKSLVDVAGGTGVVASIISEAAPRVRCTVFDLPVVISDANPEHTNNVTFVAGDMFESIPSADILFFKSILTAFNDEECLKILKQCFQVLIHREESRGKVIIVDSVKEQRNANFESIKSELCFDLLIMANVGGAQRNEIQWKKLFLDAGFTSYKITPTLGLNSIIEVFP